MTSVVVCDPPSALRRMLVEHLCGIVAVAHVETVDDAEQLSVLTQEWLPDLLLLASQPRAATIIRRLRQRAPHLRVVLLTMGTDPDEVVTGMAAGAVGYLARDAALPEIAAALALLPDPLAGSTFPPAQGSAGPSRAEPLEPGPPDVVDLTDRELQVLDGMSRGRSNSQIGAELFLSEDTIKTHARRLFRKLSVNDRAHAVAEGFRRGVLG